MRGWSWVAQAEPFENLEITRKGALPRRRRSQRGFRAMEKAMED
jgi:hypothetical protein